MIAPDIKFKFRFYKDGKAQSTFRLHGVVNEDGLHLNDIAIPYENILGTKRSDSFVIIALSSGTDSAILDALRKALNDGNTLVIGVDKKQVDPLFRRINLMSSGVRAEMKRDALAAAGKGELFRAKSCPHCGAIIDLSELNATRYVYCQYCESVFNEAGEIATIGDEYRVCPECGFFDRVKSYTEFYFIFLIWFYYFTSKRRHLCRNCAKRVVLKMFFVNTLGILGWIPTLVMAYKSMTGVDPALQPLSRANRLAKKKRFRQAIPLYEAMADRFPEHPGLIYNEMRAFFIGDEPEAAVATAVRCIASCANYLPAIELIGPLPSADGTAEPTDSPISE